MKIALIVCNHGNTSLTVSSKLRDELPDWKFLARGAIDKIPTDSEIKESSVIITPFSDERIAKLKSIKIENSFWVKWVELFKRVEGKPILKYFDSQTDDFVDFKKLALQIKNV